MPKPNFGWKNGEFRCLCQTQFGKNLNGESPYLLVSRHLDVCPKVRQLRQNIRNAYFVESDAVIKQQIKYSMEEGREDWFRVYFLRELLKER